MPCLTGLSQFFSIPAEPCLCRDTRRVHPSDRRCMAARCGVLVEPERRVKSPNTTHHATDPIHATGGKRSEPRAPSPPSNSTVFWRMFGSLNLHPLAIMAVTVTHNDPGTRIRRCP